MQCVRRINSDVFYVGYSDRRLALFENIFPLKNGVSYNSYLISDEKTALLDTVDLSVSERFFENVEFALQGRKLDYLIITHMEPDHGANVMEILKRYEGVKVVCNEKTMVLIKQFFNTDKIPAEMVKDGDTLCLGKHTLSFVMTPMVHWPEVMMCYDSTDKILYSADAFGTFGALSGNIFNDEVNFEIDFLDEARRYYTNIVGKYGLQVQNALKKASCLKIEMICPLHGPILRTNIPYILDKYDKWSSYTAEEKGVLIIYGSIFGHTENVTEALSIALAERGVKNIKKYDVSNTHVSTLISETFKYSHVVLASCTYNMHIFPLIDNYLSDCELLNVQNKTFAVIENGSWAPVSAKLIKQKLTELKNITIIDEGVTIRSCIKDEQYHEILALADKISENF